MTSSPPHGDDPGVVVGNSSQTREALSRNYFGGLALLLSTILTASEINCYHPLR
jgi:hypothetical protein